MVLFYSIINIMFYCGMCICYACMQGVCKCACTIEIALHTAVCAPKHFLQKMNAECIEHGQKNHTALSKYALLFGSLQTVDTPQSVHISSFHWGFSSCIAHTCSQHFSPTHTHTPCYSLMLLSNSIPTVPPVHKTVRDQFCCSDTGNCRRLLKVDNQSMEKKT